MTKASYTTRAHVDDSDEDGAQNGREVFAGAQEQMDTTSSLLKRR